MKILFLLCDMLRANRLKTFNPAITNPTPLDLWLNEFGGTAFTNCYTPAPDTPRSLACLYTGRYPKWNGCQKRIQWPKYYLEDGISTLFDLLLKHGFKIITNFTDAEIKVGILPKGIEACVTNYTALDSLLEVNLARNVADNSLIFLNLTDYHDSVADYNGLGVSNQCAIKHLLNSYYKVFEHFDKDDFDYTFIFSDHGCKLTDDPFFHREVYLLNDDRSKIVMLVRKQGDYGVQQVTDVTTIMDVLPTIYDILQAPHPLGEIDGISLFKPSKERLVVMEDTSNFAPVLGGYHDLWGYRDANYYYLDSLSEAVLLNLSTSDEWVNVEQHDERLLSGIRNTIRQNSCSYDEIKKQHEILQLYGKLDSAKTYFSDGIERASQAKSFAYRAISTFVKYYRRHIQ